MAKILLNVELNAQNASEEVKNLQSQLNGLSKSFGSSASSTGTAETKIQSLRIGYNNLISTIKNLQDKYPAGTFDKILKDAKAGAASVKNLDKNSKDFTRTAGKLGENLQTLKGDLAETKAETDKNADAVISHNQSILTMLPNILKWQIAMTLVMKPIQLLREGVESLNETLVKTEDTVISLQRVLDEDLSNSQISDELYKIAEDYSQTFENVSEIAENFARTGMSWTDTLAATRAAVLALNVAELDTEEASNGLIAILTQFNLEASDLTDVVDKLNKTADNFPVTTEKLLKALQRTGSSASNANVSLEETIGLITALSEATGRSGENIGTALNSLFQYSSKDSALETFSAVSDNVAKVVEEYKKGSKSIYDVWSELSKEINNLTDKQADVLDQYFQTEEGSQLAEELGAELGDVYDELQGVYSTANTFRKNYFIALLKDFDTADKASAEALTALGYSQKENQQYLDTYAAKVTTLEAKWQEIANDEQGILGVKKALVDTGIVLLDLLDWTGGLRTTFLALSTVVTIVFGNKILASVRSFGSQIKTFVTNLRAAKTEAIGFGTALNSALGIIGLVATAISIVSGAVEEYKEKQSQARQEAIQTWNDEKDTAKELNDLYAQYKEAIESNTEKDDSFYEIESKIVSLLGDKASALDGLTQKTDDYTEAVKNMTESELKRYQQDAEYAKVAAEKELEYYADESGFYETESAEKIYEQYKRSRAAADANYEAYKKAERQDPNSEITKTTKSVWENQEKVLKGFEPYINQYEDSLNSYNLAAERLDELTGNVKNNTGATVKSTEQLTEELKKAKEEVEKTEEIQEKQNAVLEAQQKLSEAIAKAQKEYLTALIDDYIDTLEQAETLEEKQNAILEARKELEEAIAEAKRKALLEAIKAEQKGQKDSLALDEKRLAVEEARKKLLEAQTNLTERIYNANTGRFEWSANKADVESAKDAYDKSLDDYNTSIEEAAWSEIEESIEEGNADTNALKKIVNKWAAQWKGDGSPAFVDSIDRIITDFEDYVPTAEDIQSATDKVKTAVTALNDYLKNQAVKEIKEYINKGNLSASGINAILDKWLKKGQGEDLYTWGNGLVTKIITNIGKYDRNDSGVQTAINNLATAQNNLSKALQTNTIWDEAELLVQRGDYTPVEVNELIRKYKASGATNEAISSVADILKQKFTTSGKKHVDAALSAAGIYDSGGVLHGLGGIKATSEDEIVLPPDITKKILTPTSNKEFHQFLQDMGIMYGAAPTTPYIKRGDIISNVNNNATNDNRSYTVNGIPISPEMARNYSIAEVLEMAAFAK